MQQIIIHFITEFWQVLATMAPYLLLGFAAAGLLSAWISPETIERHLGGRGLWPVAKAALFGVPLPLCSCGVLPVGASLRRHGASRGATTAFLLSTPQTGVDSILVTWSLLGPVFAVFRPVIALLTGLVGGALVNRIEEPTAAPAPAAPASTDDCCGDPGGHDERTSWWRRAWVYGFITLPRDIGRALVLGVLVAGIIAIAVPPDIFGDGLGTGWISKLAMMALSIPLYVCATASVPVAAALIAKGVSPGAALVFLIAGPATNAAAITTIWRILGRRSALVYLAVVAVSALGFGWLLDWLALDLAASAITALHEHRPGIFGHLGAVALVAVLAAAFWPRRSGPALAAAPAAAQRLELAVSGMTCSHCAANVRDALLACPGLDTVEVDLPTGRVLVQGANIDETKTREAVAQAGYNVDRVTHP